MRGMTVFLCFKLLRSLSFVSVSVEHQPLKCRAETLRCDRKLSETRVALAPNQLPDLCLQAVPVL